MRAGGVGSPVPGGVVLGGDVSACTKATRASAAVTRLPLAVAARPADPPPRCCPPSPLPAYTDAPMHFGVCVLLIGANFSISTIPISHPDYSIKY